MSENRRIAFAAMAVIAPIAILIPEAIKVSLLIPGAEDSSAGPNIQTPAFVADESGLKMGWWEIAAPQEVRENSDAEIRVAYRLNTEFLSSPSPFPVGRQLGETVSVEQFNECVAQARTRERWQGPGLEKLCRRPTGSEQAVPTRMPELPVAPPPKIESLKATISAPNFKITPTAELIFDVDTVFSSASHSVQHSWVLTPTQEGGPFHIGIEFSVLPKTYSMVPVLLNSTSQPSSSNVALALSVLCKTKYGISTAYISIMDAIFRGLAFLLVLPLLATTITAWLRRRGIGDRSELPKPSSQTPS